jgi:hypothetical protein
MIVSYTGKAKLAAADRPTAAVMVHVEARHRDVAGGGGSEWRGQITAGTDLLELREATLQLHLPGDRVGTIFVQDSGGNFVGVDATPI